VSRVNVLDASAVIDTLQHEVGQDPVGVALAEAPCWVTAVNLCEVLSKLCERGMPLPKAQTAVQVLKMVIVDFDAELAARAASLRVRTMPIGASLGDRACLGLAEQAVDAGNETVVYTAERAWAKIEWPFEVIVIR